MFEWVASPEGWIALGTLVALEVVLGIDNIIFISILVARLPPERQDLARRLGLGLTMLSRLACCSASSGSWAWSNPGSACSRPISRGAI